MSKGGLLRGISALALLLSAVGCSAEPFTDVEIRYDLPEYGADTITWTNDRGPRCQQPLVGGSGSRSLDGIEQAHVGLTVYPSDEEASLEISAELWNGFEFLSDDFITGTVPCTIEGGRRRVGQAECSGPFGTGTVEISAAWSCDGFGNRQHDSFAPHSGV